MVSIKDIAQVCGVSTATVSKALNNREDVNIATRERVQEVARQLGYLPNATARALKTNKTYNIGILLADKAGLTFIRNQKNSYYEHCLYRSVDGVLAACVDFDSAEIQELLGSSLPVVSVDHVSDGKFAVVSDNAQGIRSAVEYVLQMGHTRLAYIYGEESQVTAARRNAFCEVLAEHHQEVDGSMLLEGKYLHSALAYELTTQLLRKLQPTCIFYPDDISAVAGMQAIRDADLVVGGEVSVVGFDGNPLLQMAGPYLTTVRQNTKEIGERAAALMIRLLQKEEIPESERICTVRTELLKGKTVARL